jgi:SulP family sulfate permease
MAGVILLLMGLTGLGAAVRFIPRMVVIGFTNGIAILIASTQIKDFFGLAHPAVPSEFLPRIEAAHRATSPASTPTRSRTGPRHARHSPRSCRASPPRSRLHRRIACRYRGSFFFHLPVETIGSRFGGIPRGLPPFAIPDFHSEHILPLIPAAFTVAMLAALESMLSAVVADGMTGDRHNSNVELVAQGIANIVSPSSAASPPPGPSPAPRPTSAPARARRSPA